MKKRITFLLTALFAVASLWAQKFQSGELMYKVISSGDDGNAVEVTDGDYEDLTDVIIPETVEYEGVKYNVTRIGSEVFYGCTSLTSINIPESVTSIGDDAFSYCRSLTSIYIPESVTNIGYCAFDGCSNITSIYIPESVTSIGDGAFSECSNLTSINVESGNNFYDSRGNCNAIIETQSNTLIQGCNNTVIPESVTSIGNDAFAGYSNITSINIPESVTSIGDCAFEGCTSLTSINIPESVTSISFGTFAGCTSLTSINIPKSVTSIGSYAFDSSTSLASIVVESGNKVYDSRENCNAIIETESNTLILGCNKTVIPESVTSIGSSAFKGCTSLTSINIPESVTSIGSSAFKGCTSLTSINIPENVTSIGGWAFENCSSLTFMTVKATVPPTLEDEIGVSSELPIYVPIESVSAYKSVTYWKDMNIIGYDETGIDGIISDKADMTTRKVLQDGKLIIRKGDRTYDLKGTEMK